MDFILTKMDKTLLGIIVKRVLKSVTPMIHAPVLSVEATLNCPIKHGLDRIAVGGLKEDVRKDRN